MIEKREANNEDHLVNVANEFGIDRQTCLQANSWAKDWLDILDSAETMDLTDPVAIKTARDVAAEGNILISRDINGLPTFRTQYAANEIVIRTAGERGKVISSALHGGGVKVLPNFAQLDHIVDTLLNAREANKFPYNLDAAMLPQDPRNMPPSLVRGGAMHANFLFATCYYMRGGIKSTAAFSGLSRMFETSPELFDPNTVKYTTTDTVKEALQSVGLTFQAKNISQYWVQNARKLSKVYGGDARNTLLGTTKYSELLHRIQNKNGRGFLGFQEKMTSMLAYYLMADDLVPYFDFPLPVDFHVLRVSAETGIIRVENTSDDGNIYYPETLDMLRSMYHDYSTTHNINQLDVCNAVWSLSSAICGKQPGNTAYEPKGRFNRDGRSTPVEFSQIDVNNPLQQRQYERTCELCPIEPDCDMDYPSKFYYVQGRMIGRPRTRFPSATLFGSELLK